MLLKDLICCYLLKIVIFNWKQSLKIYIHTSLIRKRKYLYFLYFPKSTAAPIM